MANHRLACATIVWLRRCQRHHKSGAAKMTAPMSVLSIMCASVISDEVVAKSQARLTEGAHEIGKVASIIESRPMSVNVSGKTHG